MKPPKSDNIYTSKILERRWLSEKAFELILVRPAAFNFLSGQRIQLFHSNIDREYSLVSAPSDNDLALCIRNVEGGAMSSILSTAAIGEELTFSGPYGYFVYHSSQRSPIFVATGTGIAPFRSMAQAGVSGFTLLHGVENSGELYYASDFQKTAGKYIACLSGETGADPSHFSGRVTAYIRKNLPTRAYDFYLCGRQEMIRDVTLLVDAHFEGSHIHTELFY
jgi:ferredoxin-NADP reductase